MKKNPLFLFLFIISLVPYSKAQWIQTLEILPASPTVADSIYLIATVQTPNSTCALNQSVVTIENGVVGVNACYAHGLLTAICQRTDTISIGKIDQPGTFELLFMASLTDFGDTTCTTPQGSMMSSIEFMVDIADAVSETPTTRGFDIYPNPSHGQVDLHFHTGEPFKGQIRWVDQYGKMVYHTQVREAQTSQPLRINLSHLPDGLYYCTVTTEEQHTFTKRIMLIK